MKRYRPQQIDPKTHRFGKIISPWHVRYADDLLLSFVIVLLTFNACLMAAPAATAFLVDKATAALCLSMQHFPEGVMQ